MPYGVCGGDVRQGAILRPWPASRYDFVNVAALGCAVVARNLVPVLLFAPALAAAFWRLDVVLRRRSAPRPAAAGRPGDDA